MSVDLDTLLAAVEAEKGTRFHHQGRRPGQSLDCIGLLVTGANAIGYPVEDVQGYSPRPDAEQTLIRHLEKHFDRIEAELPERGDVLAFAAAGKRGLASHVGICHRPGFFLHAYLQQRGVIESRLDRRWARRIHSLWRWRDG